MEPDAGAIAVDVDPKFLPSMRHEYLSEVLPKARPACAGRLFVRRGNHQPRCSILADGEPRIIPTVDNGVSHRFRNRFYIEAPIRGVKLPSLLACNFRGAFLHVDAPPIGRRPRRTVHRLAVAFDCELKERRPPLRLLNAAEFIRAHVRGVASI